MSEPDPKPTPEPKPAIDWYKLATPLSVVLVGVMLLIGPRYLPSVDPTPGPTITLPVVKPVETPKPKTPNDVEPGRAFVLRNGRPLPDDEAKPLIEAFKKGDGQYVYHGYAPDGLIVRTMTIAGGPAPVVPVTPVDPNKPDVPKPPVVDPTTKPTAATYVYEKDQGGVPSAVMSGLNRLNREKKILATVFERDSTDGTETPEQYKIPLAEANKAGLPALVLTNGATVLKVIKAPKTEAEIVEAVN